MKKIISSLLVVGIIAINFGGFLSPKVAMAASLTSMSDTVSNLTASATASHVIKFTTPTGIASGETIILTFDNGTSTTGLVSTDVTVTAPGAVTVVAGAPGTTTWGFVNTSSTVLTFTLGSTATVSPSSVVTFTFNGTNKITNGAVGTTTLRVSGTLGDNDTGILSMAIITNGVVAVSAEVLGSISFAISGNAINFGTLTTSNARWATSTTGSATSASAFTMTAGTNAPTGYAISVQGDTLKSGENSIDVLASNTISSPSSEQFGIRMDETGTGTGVVSAPYLASGFAYTGTASTSATVATATAATDTSTYTVYYLANIAPLTEAGSYTTAHTYVATGNF